MLRYFVKQVGAHKYGCLLCPLPAAVAKCITDWSIENIPDCHLGDGGRETQIHVTAKYGLKDDSPQTAGAIRGILTGVGPIPIRLGAMTLFRGGDDGDVLKLEIDSPALHKLNGQITSAIPCFDKFPEYMPHVTVAYLDPRIAERYVGDLPGVSGNVLYLDGVDWYVATGEKRERVDLGLLALSYPKALSAFNEGSGGALVPPPQVGFRPRNPKLKASKTLAVLGKSWYETKAKGTCKPGQNPERDKCTAATDDPAKPKGSPKAEVEPVEQAQVAEPAEDESKKKPAANQSPFGKMTPDEVRLNIEKIESRIAEAEKNGADSIIVAGKVVSLKDAKRGLEQQRGIADRDQRKADAESDAQFAKEWAAEVEKHLPEVEANNVAAYPYSAQEVAAEQDWHKQYIEWRWGLQAGEVEGSNKGKFKPTEMDVGPASRFVSGLLNPALGGVAYVGKLFQELVAPRGKTHNPADPAIGDELQAYFDRMAPEQDNQQTAQVVAAVLGAEAVPVVKALAAKGPQVTAPVHTQPLTDEELAKMTPAQRSEAVAAERAARQRPKTELRQAAEGGLTKPGKDQNVQGRIRKLEQKARGKERKRQAETPEQSAARQEKERVKLVERRKKQDARVRKYQQQDARQKERENKAAAKKTPAKALT